MNPSKRTQKVANRSPYALNRVCVDFTDTIRIGISGPLTIAMTDHGMMPVKIGIAPPSICINDSIATTELMHMCREGRFIGVMDDAQSHASALTTKAANDRGTVVGVSAVAPAFVATPPGRVRGIRMPFAFLTRILEHLIGLNNRIRQNRPRLQREGIRLDLTPYGHHGLTRHTDLATELRTRDALADATQQ